MDLNQYGKLLLEVNDCGYCGASPWVFADGMGFNDEAVWWGSKWEKRPVAHEGVDFVQFTDTLGRLVRMSLGFVVVSPVAGVVVGVCNDYLAQTLWVRVDQHPQRVVALCHLQTHVRCGQRLCCGDPVGKISYQVKNVPLHLHLSVLFGDWQSMPDLTWEVIHHENYTTFVYPDF